MPVVFVAALTAACSPHRGRSARPRELFSYRDLVARIKRASSCLARVQNELQQYSTNILFDLVDLEVLKDVNLFMNVLEQDTRDRKVDPDAPKYDVVSDTDYLNPVLVCRPIPPPTGFIHSTRYQA